VAVSALADVHRADFRHQGLSRGTLAPERHGAVRQQIVRLRRRLELILIDSGVNEVYRWFARTQTSEPASTSMKALDIVT
jgi:hypothetical protein